MPRETVEAVARPRRDPRRHARARTSRAPARCSTPSTQAGIDYDDVVETLEREGVEKFANSFKELFEDIESKRDQLVAA